ncbi:VanZ family protein [Pseudaminobacter soli (ex Zhang et al. 2022)]|uniref:VanZ family protein n=1 Tax=Pseudaminobacter soli (ex Zhang et al. 2022) TaxID=2831468 RepID=UPI003CC7DFC8
MKSFARPIAWLLLAAILYVTISPIQARPVTHQPVSVERLVAFGLLGLAFVIGYPRRWLLAACFVIGLAFVFEAAQLLAATRHARFDDALVKAIGAAIGVTIGVTINRLSLLRH